MAVKVSQSSFTGGELDPVLQERTTFDKYKNGLTTARNVIVFKTGSIGSRMARKHFINCRYTDREVRIYSPPNSGYLIEFGHLYYRVYTADGTLVATTAHLFTEDPF